MTEYPFPIPYHLPFDYPSVPDWGQNPPDDVTTAIYWAESMQLTGTVGQLVYAYRLYGIPSSSGCFIATAAYGTPLGRDLDTLRAFRDEKLPDELVDLYYRASPPFARVISHSAILRWVIRQPLGVIVWILSNT